MKHGRLIIAALVGAMLITSLAGCGSKGTNDGESGEYQKINLSMAVNGTDTQIDSLVAHHFADLVSERSGGNIVIDVFSNDTLAGGNSTKGVEYIAVGGSDLGAYATCVLANLEPKLSVATLPWSFTSYQQAREVIDSTGGEYYAELLEAKGITYLGSFHNGFRQLTNSKHRRHQTGGSEGSQDPCSRLRGVYGCIQRAGRQPDGHELERGLHCHPAGHHRRAGERLLGDEVCQDG